MNQESPEPALPDPEEFKVATDPLELGTYMIEANAGTGKTYTLCHIVVRLISEQNIPIERILAVTFTNAAANELGERIRQALIEAKEELETTRKNTPTSEASVRLQRIRMAIASFDDARIFTIHAFCQRILQEFSFDCGVHPETELLADDTPLLREIAGDFRRIRLAQSNPVTAALSLGKKLRIQNMIEGYRDSRSHNNEEPDEPDTEQEGGTESDWNEEALENNYNDLVASWWNSEKAIEEFVNEATFGKIKNRLAKLKDRFRKAHRIGYPDGQLIELVCECLETLPRRKKQFELSEYPEFFKQAERFVQACRELEKKIIRSFRVFCDAQLPATKEARNIRTFDDLQKLVAEGLSGETGTQLIKNVSNDYDAALIDEFQDTDPLQFRIVQKLFFAKDQSHANTADKRIYYIGDPKQSIFAFRGADLDNYLDIRSELPPEHTKSLLTNYRAYPPLVEAANALFLQGGAHEIFGDERIAFHASATHDLNESNKKFARRDRALRDEPLQIRFLESSKKESAKRLLNTILNDLAKEIVLLLDGNSTIGDKPMRGSDVAVLCQTHDQARNVLKKLSGHGVPCVLHSNRNIFETDEAGDFEILMEALLHPHRADLVRKALATRLLGHNAEDLVGLEKATDKWDARVSIFFELKEIWRKKGIFAAFSKVLYGDWKNQTVLKGHPSETSEQPDSIEQEQDTGNNASVRILTLEGGERRLANYLHLGELLHEAENATCPTPRTLFSWLLHKRTEVDHSDENLVRLESDEQAVQILTIHRSKGLEYPVTFCPFNWKPAKKAKNQQTFNEHVRLLYVALTRASSRLYLYFKAGKNFSNSSLSRLFKVSPSFEDLQEWVSTKPGLVALQPVDATGPIASYRSAASADDPALLTCRPFTRRVPPDHIVTSFSGLMKKKVIAEKDHDSEPPHFAFIPKDQREGAFTFPAGSKAGNFFHNVFESIDFRDNDHSQVIADQLNQHGLWNADPNLAARIITATLETPLTDGFGGSIRLSQLAPENRINELGFHFTTGKTIFRELGEEMLRDGFGQPFAGYLRRFSNKPDLQNEEFLKGFIDLVHRQGERYYLLDWKSNLLGGKQEDFRQNLLQAPMEASDYVMQYHLYTVALHRFLSTRLPNYQYEEHFGGVHYLFIRGMLDPVEEGDGIFYDRPDKQLLDHLNHAMSLNGELTS